MNDRVRTVEVDVARLLQPRPGPHPGQFLLDVPDGLQQGRGAWGGVATGAITAAAQLADSRPGLVPRNISAQLVAPLLVGPARIDVEFLRQGTGTSVLSARVSSEQGLVAAGVVVLGVARRGEGIPDGPGWNLVEAPQDLAAGPEAVDVVPLGPPMAPHFLQHLEVRPIRGFPYTGTVSEVTGWVRPLAPVYAVEMSLMVALADAWWVAAITAFDRPRPVGTLSFTADLPLDPADLPREPDGRLRPLFHRGRLLGAREGYLVEERQLWTVDGRLAVSNVQTVTVIK